MNTQTIERRKPENLEQKNKRVRDRELNDIRTVISTPEGRRFYWRLLTEGAIFKNGYVHGDSGYGTTFNSGRHSIGLWALSELMESKSSAFTQMQREHASEEQRDRNEQEEREEEKDILSISD